MTEETSGPDATRDAGAAMKERLISDAARVCKDVERLEDHLDAVGRLARRTSGLAYAILCEKFGGKAMREGIPELPEAREFRRFAPRPKQAHYFAERQRLAERNRELSAELDRVKRRAAGEEADRNFFPNWKYYQKIYNDLWSAVRDAGHNPNELLDTYRSKIKAEEKARQAPKAETC